MEPVTKQVHPLKYAQTYTYTLTPIQYTHTPIQSKPQRTSSLGSGTGRPALQMAFQRTLEGRHGEPLQIER